MFAVRYRKRFGILAAFAAGVLIAVSFFDLHPEAFTLATKPGVPLEQVLYGTAVGFIFLLILQNLLSSILSSLSVMEVGERFVI